MLKILPRLFLLLVLGQPGCATDVTPEDTPEQTVPSYEETVVFEGDDTYPVVRIPSIIETPSGALLAFVEGRESINDHGNIDVIMRRSEDNGVTWGPVQVIVDFGVETAGNPAPVVDRNTGRIWLPYCTNTSEDIYQRNVWITYSDDDGATWAQPTDITEQVKPDNWKWYATGPGRGIQLQNGRLVIPCNHFDENRTRRSHVIYSDDHGETWQVGGVTAPGTDESQVAELSDGSIMMNSRFQGDELYRAISYSTDGGETWSETTFDESLPDPHCQGSLLMTTHGLVFTNPATQEEFPRDKLTVRISLDEGNTWHHARELDRGPSAYSALAQLSDGRIGVVWESGDLHPYESIRFAAFTSAWVEGD